MGYPEYGRTTKIDDVVLFYFIFLILGWKDIQGILLSKKTRLQNNITNIGRTGSEHNMLTVEGIKNNCLFFALHFYVFFSPPQ